MATQIHHLNCGTMRPLAAPGGRLMPRKMVAHCLLVERPDGLLLVDTGFGTGDLADRRRLGRPFLLGVRPDLSAGETALAQVERLGFAPDDVTDVVLTHLDVDHAGGIADFAGARVHVAAAEHAAAMAPASLMEKQRYLPVQWAHGPRWELHEAGGDDWFGFTGVRVLGDDVVLIPLRGHTRGHSGVAVRKADGSWLLHAGDSYFSAGEIETPPAYNLGMAGFQKLMAVHEKERRTNQSRLRELHAGHPEITIFSAHDVTEFDRLAAPLLPR
jgi:glyoxylase-like metal-dependent hydrolase (beta-lactamase superfamily II)